MLEGYVEKTLTRLGFEREYTEQTTHQRLTEILAKNISDDELKESLERGERMAAAEALASAVSGAPV
jgi:hypothetical protein